MTLGQNYRSRILELHPLHSPLHRYHFVHDVVYDYVNDVANIKCTLDEQHVPLVQRAKFSQDKTCIIMFHTIA